MIIGPHSYYCVYLHILFNRALYVCNIMSVCVCIGVRVQHDIRVQRYVYCNACTIIVNGYLVI